MLIRTSPKVGSVVTIKMPSGEELLARYNSETDTYLEVMSPKMLQITNQGIGLIPYLFTIDEAATVRINKPVVVMELTDSEFAKQYLQSTTGIAL